MHATITALAKSDNPHLYLSKIGLSRAAYYSTAELSSVKKERLAQKILEQATEEQVLKIIRHLVQLEFAIETQDPFRTGNRFIGVLLRAYIARHEGAFNDFYQSQIKTGEKRLKDYPVSVAVVNLWDMIKEEAKNKLSAENFKQVKGTVLHILPTFYLQQLLPIPTPEEVLQGAPKIELTRDRVEVSAFNSALNDRVEIRTHYSNLTPETMLAQLKEHILATNWQVGGCFFFHGGVKNGNQRLPHRVNDILNLLTNSRLNPVDIYAQIVTLAQHALDYPRSGRCEPTTLFYQAIVSHNILSEEYQFNQRGLTATEVNPN